MQDPSYFACSNAKQCISSAVPQTRLLCGMFGEQHGTPTCLLLVLLQLDCVLLLRDSCLIRDTRSMCCFVLLVCKSTRKEEFAASMYVFREL